MAGDGSYPSPGFLNDPHYSLMTLGGLLSEATVFYVASEGVAGAKPYIEAGGRYLILQETGVEADFLIQQVAAFGKEMQRTVRSHGMNGDAGGKREEIVCYQLKRCDPVLFVGIGQFHMGIDQTRLENTSNGRA